MSVNRVSSPGLVAPRHGSATRQRTAATIVAVTLVVATAAFDPWGFRPFTTIRWPLVAIGVVVATALVWPQRARLPRWLWLTGLAFLGWLTLAALVGVDPVTAWLGHPQRHLGLVTWVVCLLGFRLGTALSGDRIHRVLGVGALVGAALLGLGALVDLVGWHPAGVNFPGTRVGGFTGLPALLGAAGVLLVPLAFGAAAQVAPRWRRLGQAAAVLGLVAVVASQTRGAWIGLLVAAVVAWPVLGPRSRSTQGLAVAGLGVLVVVAVLTPVGGRVVSLFDLNDGTSKGRVSEWHLATGVVADHPLVGVGPEGYRIVVPGHIDDGYTRSYGREVIVDRAHNGVLDLVVVGGVPAGALLVVLVGGVGITLWRGRGAVTPFVAGATAATFGYLAQQLFLFPLAEVEPLAWIIAGVAWVGARSVTTTGAGSAGASGATGDDAAEAAAPEVAAPGLRGVRTVLVVGALAVLVIGGLDVVADRRLAAAGQALTHGDQRRALVLADAATTLRPDSIDAWYVAAEVAASGPSLVDLDDGLDRVESGLAVSARDPALLDLHERLLTERALRSELPDDRARALAAVDRRLVDDPSNPAHSRHQGLLLVAEGSDGAARLALARALSLDPGDLIARRALDELDEVDA